MRILSVSLLLFLAIGSTIPNVFPQNSTPVLVRAERVVPLEIKIVFVGFDSSTLDLDYILWDDNIPKRSVNNVITDSSPTGTVFNFSYNFVFTSESFRDALTNYLSSIEQRKVEYNPWFERELENIVYDARSVENWFITRNETYGRFPKNGYTFVFANLTKTPSISLDQINNPRRFPPTPHYYSNNFVDVDLDYKIRFRDFAVAWGGKSRLWFLDFSAGPEFWTWTNPEPLPHLPLQVALSLYEVKIHEPEGRRWLSQLMADYIAEVVWTFAAPQFAYLPMYSPRYRIVVNLFDNRTSEEREEVDVSTTIDEQRVLQAFADLVPYSSVEIELKTLILDADSNNQIRQLIVNSTFIPPSNLRLAPYVDIRPVYRYLQNNMKQYQSEIIEPEIVYPVFAFAFSSGYAFGITFRWFVAGDSDQVKTLFGISLGDMALVGLSQDEFMRGDFVSVDQRGKGIGFTEFIVHEVGHSFGLTHVNSRTYLGDFVSSSMSYYAWEYQFSQFEKDALGRSYADQLMIEAATYLAQARSLAATNVAWLDTARNWELAQGLLRTAENNYEEMDYGASIRNAAEAVEAAKSAVTGLNNSPPTIAVTFLLSSIVAFLAGSFLILMAMRRYIRNLRLSQVYAQHSSD
jgi:hypothetical protein